MNILFTGGSSFVGYWFVYELAKAGHNVTATFLRRQQEYSGLRLQRINTLPATVNKQFNIKFGSAAFMRVIEQQPQWDMLCHHAADVQNHKSMAFNATTALANNTKNLPAILAALKQRGCKRMVLTGTGYESGEGGTRGSQAVYPYGLSKSLTTAYCRYYTHEYGMRLGHFVISNPFGALNDEQRFTTYLIDTWVKNETAIVQTPDYIRDNIHISLLSKEYVRFCNTLKTSKGLSRARPCGYIETRRDFAKRYANEMRKRLPLSCLVKNAIQTDFSETIKRVNNQPPDARALNWSEEEAWDSIANSYKEYYSL